MFSGQILQRIFVKLLVKGNEYYFSHPVAIFHSKMSTRNIVHAQLLEADDLDVDCAPYSSPSEVLKKSTHHFISDKCDSVCDSGVDLESVGSAYGSMHSFHERRSETELIEKRMGGLCLESQKYTSITEDAKCSIDDGYKSYQSDESCVQIAPSKISPEVLELYNQDIDGDS